MVYTHNLADKHDTHIGVVVAAIQAHARIAAPPTPAESHRLRSLAQSGLAGR